MPIPNRVKFSPKIDAVWQALSLADQARFATFVQDLKTRPMFAKKQLQLIRLALHNYYVYRLTPSIRVLITKSGDTWTIQDVVHRDRLPTESR